MQLILASASPRRKALLALFRRPFLVRAADIDETMDPEKAPFDEVARVSREKALAVPRESGDIVVAADTIVVCEGKILGKPHSEAEAAAMLSLLSGRDHQVMTGCTVLRDGVCETVTEVTDLHFRPLSPREIDAYVQSGEPMDKAGAYGIQGGAALFCQRIEGDYYNVMGLPVCRLGQMLQKSRRNGWRICYEKFVYHPDKDHPGGGGPADGGPCHPQRHHRRHRSRSAHEGRPGPLPGGGHRLDLHSGKILQLYVPL